MSRTITVSSAAIPNLLGQPALEFLALNGGETLSELFNYRLTLRTPANPMIAWQAASNIDLKALLGAEMTVSIELDGKGTAGLGRIGAGVREVSGLVTKARFMRRDENQAIYEVELQPWLHLATLTSDYKRFHQKTVVEIIEEVLADYSFPVEKRLTGAYPTLDYQVQYGETDFMFVQRLMQEFGIYWFFEHSDQKHRLILVDQIGAHRKVTSAAYHVLRYRSLNGRIDEEYVDSFDTEENLQPGQWVTSDFDFTQPRADLRALDKKPRKTSHNELEMYQWPGDYEDQAVGDQIARIRMEAAGAAGSRSTGAGQLRGVVCGCTFTLAGYPQEKANREYLTISANLSITDNGQTSGRQTFSYHCDFTVQPTTKLFRPAQTIRKPHTTGPQTAVVAGPAGQQIWTDEYGRVKVQFHWDRYGKKDENSSCWIRVSSPWAGSGFGGIQIPRIGQEVIVDFENGDPDRPIITGRVYNAMNMPPWSLPANATQSGMLTRTKDGGISNANAIRFEDKQGAEELWIHAEKDQRIEVENDESHSVDHDRTKTIGNDETTHIKRNRTETVDADETVVIHQNRKERVDLDETISIGANRTEDVGVNETVLIGGNRSVTIGGNKTETIGLNKAETIAIAKAETIGAAKTLSIGGLYQITVGAAMNTSVALMQAEEIGLSQSSMIGKNHSMNIGGNQDFAIGKDQSVSVGQNIKITAGSSIEIVCGESSITMDKSGHVKINGHDLILGTTGDQYYKAGGDITMKAKNIKGN